jgi:chloride channel 3/4/5
MFELTGALTYILPTMIVVMVTKGVGDYYGKGGIAEQTMKFAGYPFLDKDEHNFGLLPVGEVMKRDPDMVFADGTPLKDVEERLNNTYRGFPVVRSQSDRTLLGYVGKTELRFAINKAKRARSSLGADIKCYFTCEETGAGSAGIGRSEPPPTAGTLIDEEEEEDKIANSDRDGDREGLMNDTARGRSSMTSLGGSDQEDDHYGDLGGVNGGVDGEGEEDLLELGEWVDQTPLTVGPNMPLEVVMDLFKKMGPRVILITDRQGAMQGLVTVKDLLKHIAAQEHADALARRAAREALDAQGGLPEWVIAGDTSGEADGNVINNFGGELERSLSEAWSWAKQRMAVWREGGSARHSSRRTGPEYAELHERGQSQEGSAAEVLYDGEGEEEGYDDLEGADDGGPSSAYATAQPRSQFGTPVTPTSTRARDESDQFVIE